LLFITYSCCTAGSHIIEACHRGGEFYKKGVEFVSKKYFARYGSRHRRAAAERAATGRILMYEKLRMADNIRDKVSFAKGPRHKKISLRG